MGLWWSWIFVSRALAALPKVPLVVESGIRLDFDDTGQNGEKGRTTTTNIL